MPALRMSGNDLSGSVALVTGGAKRLGRAIALALARSGADVALHYGRSRAEAEETCGAIQACGRRAWLVQADLADRGATEAMFDAAARAAGGIDLLINNASIFPAGKLDDLSEEDLLENVRINTLAPLWLSRKLAAQGKPAAIVNLLDTRVTDYDRRHVAYYLSKRMLLDLTRMLALEFAPAIRVNGVAPGLVLPPPGQDERYLADMAATLPLQRSGTADDVAAAVLFLLAADFTTGQVIFVDGGRHLEGSFYD